MRRLAGQHSRHWWATVICSTVARPKHRKAEFTMSQHSLNSTASLREISDTWGEAQIVATPNRVIVDLDARNFDTAGHCRHERALLSLTISAAAELRDAINDAIMVAAASHAVATGVWGDSTHRAVVRRSARGAAA